MTVDSRLSVSDYSSEGDDFIDATHQHQHHHRAKSVLADFKLGLQSPLARTFLEDTQDQSSEADGNGDFEHNDDDDIRSISVDSVKFALADAELVQGSHQNQPTVVTVKPTAINSPESIFTSAVASSASASDSKPITASLAKPGKTVDEEKEDEDEEKALLTSQNRPLITPAFVAKVRLKSQLISILLNFY